MSFNIDSPWKWILPVVGTIASIFIPIIWSSYHDQNSLRILVVSQTDIQAATTATVNDVQITLDGAVLKTPYLSIIEIKNDGTKPIESSKFESPIRINIESNSQIRRARISSTSPPGITPEINTEDKSITIRPLLLNPDDTIKITILTSEARPNFVSTARISSIKSITTKETMVAIPNQLSRIVATLSGFLLLFLSGCIMTLALKTFPSYGFYSILSATLIPQIFGIILTMWNTYKLNEIYNISWGAPTLSIIAMIALPKLGNKTSERLIKRLKIEPENGR